MEELARLRNFSETTGIDLKDSLNNMAADLSRGPLSGNVAFAVTGGDTDRLLMADLNRPEVDEVTEGSLPTAPDFLIYVQTDALVEILRGELSPITALRQGRLRYAGNEGLGLAIFRELASTQDAIFEPCRQSRRQ